MLTHLDQKNTVTQKGACSPVIRRNERPCAPAKALKRIVVLYLPFGSKPISSPLHI